MEENTIQNTNPVKESDNKSSKESDNKNPDLESLLIEQHVRKIVGKWLRWIGILNAATIVPMIAYVIFYVPTQAADLVVPVMNDRIANLTIQLETSISNGLILSGKAQQTVEQIQKQSSDLGFKIAGIEEDLEAFTESGVAKVSALIETLQNSQSVSNSVTNLVNFEQSIANLGQTRTGVSLTINNPRIAGANSADCPPGSFVSKISATKGVGGKYAADGISEISIICSSIQ